MHLLPAAAILSLTLYSGHALAGDLVVNAGMLEVASIAPEHVGAYPYVALSLVVPTEHVTWIPSLGLEWAPELGAWGVVGSLTADFPVSTGLGIDAIVSIVHDQVGGAFRESTFYAGLGAGVSVFLGRWTISPSVSLFRGLNADAWTVGPALNVGFAL
jgi:hypothetical protein